MSEEAKPSDAQFVEQAESASLSDSLVRVDGSHGNQEGGEAATGLSIASVTNWLRSHFGSKPKQGVHRRMHNVRGVESLEQRGPKSIL